MNRIKVATISGESYMRKSINTFFCMILLSLPASAQYNPPAISFPTGQVLPTSCTGASVFTLSTTHQPYYCNGGTYTAFGSGGGGGGTTNTICSGTVALGTAAIASGAAATTVTATCSGLETTDAIALSFNGSPLAVTGYIPSASGMLTILSWPSSGEINVAVVNNTAASITPGAITLNFRVTR
jgi:hypothetical protein